MDLHFSVGVPTVQKGSKRPLEEETDKQIRRNAEQLIMKRKREFFICHTMQYINNCAIYFDEVAKKCFEK